MSAGSTRPGAILAAIVLSVLTLGVFAAAQNSGPESAVVRFHEAIFRGDLPGAAALAGSPGDDPAFASLVSLVREAARTRAAIQVDGVSKNGRDAMVRVSYRFPQGVLVVGFLVRKPDRTWVIDASGTVGTPRPGSAWQ